jgi:hypothetical protein
VILSRRGRRLASSAGTLSRLADVSTVIHFRSSGRLDRCGDQTCARRCVCRNFIWALTYANSDLLLVGQQLLWTEQSSPENLDSIVWPRAASSAEVFWTGATLPDSSPRNVSSALPRLHDIRYRMVQRGVGAIPLQPQWCALRSTLGLCGLNA